ncbi:MAG: flagellar hook-basal body complex protein FliE [Pseudomonadota bacterium]
MTMTTPAIVSGLPELQPAASAKNTTAKGLSGFGNMLSSALEDARENKEAADAAAGRLALGQEADIHSTMIAIEKADISFQFLMQIRNKIISAYETVMRTQV